MKKHTIALLPILLLAAASSFAQTLPSDRCGDDELISDCFGRLSGATVEAKVADDVAKANTGIQALTSPLQSPLRDFLSLFAASADMATLSQKDDGTLTLDWNIGSQQFTTGRPLKLQAVFNKPQLNAKVKAALGGELLQQEEASLRDTDDAALSLSYSPQNRALGRTLLPHRPLLELLTGVARNEEDPAATTLALAAVLSRFEDEEPIKSDPELTKTKFRDLTAVQKAVLGPAIAAAAAEQSRLDQSYGVALKALGVDDFKKLLNQQPQAYASVVQRSRDPLVGADETSFKVTWESSGRALSTFYKEAKPTCDDARLAQAVSDASAEKTRADSQAIAGCLAAWDAFRTDSRTKAALNSASRLAFSLEYSGIRPNKVALASPPQSVTPDPFTLSTPSSESLIGSVTYGFDVVGNGPGTREGRIDLGASYENVTGDENRDNRFVVSAVYAQKVNDMLTMPIGIVYANRDRYLKTFSDRGLSMHFGLVFKVTTLDALAKRFGGN
jgi:hypothetical protein